MPLPTVNHFAGSNTTICTINTVDLYFSYQTLIAFRADNQLILHENDWSVNTGKHLNAINRDKSLRVCRTAFEALFNGIALPALGRSVNVESK